MWGNATIAPHYSTTRLKYTTQDEQPNSKHLITEKDNYPWIDITDAAGTRYSSYRILYTPLFGPVVHYLFIYWVCWFII